MMRVLFVNAEAEIGGAERSLLLLMAHLSDSYALHLACPTGGALADEARRLGCMVHDIAPRVSRRDGRLRFLSWLAVTNLRVRAIVRTNAVDVVHGNSIYAALGMLWAMFRGGRQVVAVWHARDFVSMGFLGRVCARAADRVVAVSEAVRSWLIGQGMAGEKIEIVYNGVDCGGEVSSIRGDGPIVFANVGQFAPWKKQTLFLDAASLASGQLSAAEFVIVGGDRFGGFGHELHSGPGGLCHPGRHGLCQQDGRERRAGRSRS